MRVTLNIFNPNPRAGDQDSLLTLEVFSEMLVSTLRESVQLETGIPTKAQHIYHNGRLVSDDSKTMEQLQISDGDMLAVHVRDMGGSAAAPEQARPAPARPRPAAAAAAATPDSDAEMIRLQILGNPIMRAQLARQHPELASAVDDSVRFTSILHDSRDREQRERLERQREIERLNEDPFNVENQRRIEEMIRQERVMENLQNAMEHNPEVFGRVHLLYADVEVNGHKVKALVDSGAQATIMSPSCAEACGIMRLVDKRFAGVARGVGTATIIGRVHSAQIKIGTLFLPCSFTVMEGKSVGLLLGLDMLKRYQAHIDLEKDKLIIQGQEIPFLGEAEIPRDEEAAAVQEPTIPGPGGTTIGQRSGAVVPAESAAASSPSQSAPPAQGQAGPTQASSGAAAPPAAAPASSPSSSRQPADLGVRVTPAYVESLVSMGASREDAVHALQVSNDNLDMAISLIFF